MKDINYLEEMSNFVVASKYARYNPSLRRREIWEESVQRNLNMHLRKFSHLDEADVSEIKRAFEMVKEKWIIPSMRSMQFGGPAIEQSNARMYNCATIHIASIRSFAEVFYMLLCGAGVTVGLNTRFMSRLPNLVDASDKNGVVLTYVVEDTIEGWSNSLEALLSCYFRNTPFTGRKIIFDYSRIRKKGALLKTSGGKAPGYKGLKACHIKIKQLLDFIIEQQWQTRLKTINAYDILMHASDAVLSGGIRRSAMMAIFEESDEDMLNSKAVFDVDHISRYSVDDTTNVAEVKLIIDRKEYVVSFDLKKAFDKYDYEKLLNEKKISWFWVEPQRARSNNSVLLLRKDLTLEKFKHYIQTAQLYGEPGFLLADDPYTLVNPCAEIGMIPVTEDGRCGVQVCNLTSINGAKVHTVEEFQAAAKAASLIGTLQAAYTDFPFLSTATKQITEQEALLGVSITGILDNPELFLNKEALQNAAATVVATNKEWAAKLGINQAARTTCCKPEGTSSLVLGSASGIHPHHARKYFRRIQCNHEDPVYQFFKQYNPHACESSMWSANHTDDVISFPVEIPETAMIKADLSALDHLKIIQTVQENWVLPGTTPVNKKPIRHNVSCTVIVKNDEWDTAIEHIYNNREFYTAVSFIPETGDKIYQQAPLEAVTTKEDAALFDLLKASWLKVDYSKMHENSDGTAHTQEAACVGGACELTRI